MDSGPNSSHSCSTAINARIIHYGNDVDPESTRRDIEMVCGFVLVYRAFCSLFCWSLSISFSMLTSITTHISSSGAVSFNLWIRWASRGQRRETNLQLLTQANGAMQRAMNTHYARVMPSSYGFSNCHLLCANLAGRSSLRVADNS